MNQPGHAKRKQRRRLITIGVGAVNMILGAIIGMLVQGAAEATGVMGPTIETVIAQQDANFKDIRAKLEALDASDDPAEQQRLRIELTSLIQQQEQLAQRTQAELRAYERQVESLRAEALATRGTAGGADFWLQAGESATVGQRGSVIGLLSIHRNDSYVHVNFGGAKHYLYPGDALDIPVGDGTGKVVFKHAKDGRAGFDYIPPQGRGK